MERSKHPTFSNGKICYLEIPANNVLASATFYKKIFGWHIRERSDGHIAFDDTTGEVSGTWVIGRNPAIESGVLVYIMVDNLVSIVRAIPLQGGKIIEEPDAESTELIARFSDPAGNVFGLYQEPVR